MSHQVKKPKTARDAMRYFHAVALDYVTDLKKQFPNHDISIDPSTLPYHPLSQLTIEVRVWDRSLHIEFQMFTEPKRDDTLHGQIIGKGRIHLYRIFDCLLYLLPYDKNEWRYWKGPEQTGVLDADFLLERMRLLLDQAPD